MRPTPPVIVLHSCQPPPPSMPQPTIVMINYTHAPTVINSPAYITLLQRFGGPSSGICGNSTTTTTTTARLSDVTCKGCRLGSQHLEQSLTTNNCIGGLSMDPPPCNLNPTRTPPPCNPATRTIPDCDQLTQSVGVVAGVEGKTYLPGIFRLRTLT